MSKSEFNSASFYQALDSARAAKGLNWKQVAQQSGVSASTLTRIAQGRRPDVDSMAALVSWSGLKADAFVRSDRARTEDAEPLALITTQLMSDTNLSEDGREAMIEMVTAAYLRLKKRSA